MNSDALLGEALVNPDSPESLFKEGLSHFMERGYPFDKAIIAPLAAIGWNRRKFFDVAMHLQFKQNPSEHLSESIGEFFTALEGNCDPMAIIKVPGEEWGGLSLTAYVRGKKWL